MIRDGKLPLRDDLTLSGGASLPRCSQLVYLNKKTKEAYFIGRGEQSKKLEAALAPCVNIMFRTRTVAEDLGVADAVKKLEELRQSVSHQLDRLDAALPAKATTTKKHDKKSSSSKDSSSSKKDKHALKKAQAKKAEALAKLKQATVKAPAQAAGSSKKRKAEHVEAAPDSQVPSSVPIMPAPLLVKEQEQQQQQPAPVAVDQVPTKKMKLVTSDAEESSSSSSSSTSFSDSDDELQWFKNNDMTYVDMHM